MNTKEKGDIAEYAVVAEALKRGFNVLIPIGDRLPFDFLIAYIEERNLFYVMPISFYLSRKSSIHLNPEPKKYGRTPDSEKYNEAWALINAF